MITAVDSSVLIDIFIDDPTFGKPSAHALRQCLKDGVVGVCGVVWGECAAVFSHDAALQEAMGTLNIQFMPLTEASATRAGQAWREYRRKGGRRTRLVADFLIGAHAFLQCDRLLTRDRGFYRSYFPDLAVLDPSA